LIKEKVMLKNKYFVFALIILGTVILNAQPYYYTSTYVRFPYGSHHTGSIYRINLSNPAEVESLMTNVYDLGSPVSDEFGNWIAYENGLQLTIMDLNNQNRKNIISKYCEGTIKLSYAGDENKLVILYLGDYPDTYKLVLVNPMTLTLTDTIPSNIHWECSRSKDINFSQSGDLMYLMKTDTVLQKQYIASYSLSSQQIIATKYINELSESGADEFFFNFRRNGLSVIESLFLSPSPTSYYKIYFLDKDSLSIPIVRDDSQTWADGYVANDGEYLLLFANLLTPDSLDLNPTGKIDIYEMKNGQLLKTVQLPPDGEVMCFENYPNNVYYVKDIELPTRQVWNLKMDSIFNELDLSSLVPSMANVNSPSFTLTVKGIGFDTLSTIYFNGQAKTTTFISDSVLTAEILASDVSVAGTFPVLVIDEWAASDTLYFNVVQSVSVGINQITPAMSLVNPGAFTMEVKGRGFNSSSVVYFNGNARATSFVSDSTLNTQILSTDVNAAGNFPVWVSDGTTNSDTLIYNVVSALPQPVRPVLECVRNNGDGTYTAFFGYKNENTVSVYIPVGSKNKFTPNPQDRGQTRVFLPGRQYKVYTVNFNGSNLVWTLNGRTSTASRTSAPCQ
jgi:hypothetical protein